MLTPSGEVQQVCEWCGQPAARQDPTLCAECYYKYWSKSKEEADAPKRVNGFVYSE